MFSCCSWSRFGLDVGSRETSITMLVKGSGWWWWWFLLDGDSLIGIFQLLRGGERMGDKNRGNVIFSDTKTNRKSVDIYFTLVFSNLSALLLCVTKSD